VVLVAPVEVYDNGPRHVVVAVQDAAIVAALDVDHGGLIRAVGTDGTSVCAPKADGGWSTRMFAPGAGIPEDPATGSAAGPVGVHLLRHGLVEAGREIVLSQGVEMLRPSVLRVRVDGTADAIAGVGVGGSAVIVGELTLRR
jgi:trans-2,3-dihydro-3-hydroxyanthranilate isomerase